MQRSAHTAGGPCTEVAVMSLFLLVQDVSALVEDNSGQTCSTCTETLRGPHVALRAYCRYRHVIQEEAEAS